MEEQKRDLLPRQGFQSETQQCGGAGLLRDRRFAPAVLKATREGNVGGGGSSGGTN